MEPPLIDKVARRRSTVAILISLLALWISLEGIDAVCANFMGLALSTFVTIPLMLVYVVAIFLLLQTPKLFQRLKNLQHESNPTEETDSTNPERPNKPVEATTTSHPFESESKTPPPLL